MPIAAKLYNKMFLNRIVPHIELLLRKHQHGFRGRSTLSQILCLRRLIEEPQAFHNDLALVFVDFSKAFDSVDRNKMFEILELYGIPPKIIDCIKVLYNNTSATIPDSETEAFSNLAGILQGYTFYPSFSSLLLIIFFAFLSIKSAQKHMN